MYLTYLNRNSELELELHTSQHSIPGKLYITDGSWQFSSSHPVFTQLFPTKQLDSASDQSINPEAAEVYQAISHMVSSLIRYE